MAQHMRRHVFEAGGGRGARKGFLDTGDGLALEFDRLFAAKCPCRASAACGLGGGQECEWLVDAYSSPQRLGLPIEHARLKIDKSLAFFPSKRRAANGGAARSGIEANEQKSGDVLAGLRGGRDALLDFAIAPGRLYQPGGL